MSGAVRKALVSSVFISCQRRVEPYSSVLKHNPFVDAFDIDSSHISMLSELTTPAACGFVGVVGATVGILNNVTAPKQATIVDDGYDSELDPSCDP